MISVAQVCRVEGCGRKLKRRDLCGPHYRRFTAGLSVDDYEPQVCRKEVGCAVPNCDREHHAKGWCNAHYLRSLKGLDMTDPITKGVTGVCPVPKCGRPVRTRGMCRTHYQRSKAGKPLDTPIKDVTPTYGCKYPKCIRPHSGKGYCAIHGTIKRRYSMTDEQMTLLSTAVCHLCEAAESSDGRSLSVDHDHSCCPGDKSCGKCVRGFLCSACNTALGLFRDRTDLILKAVKYLQDPPGASAPQGVRG